MSAVEPETVAQLMENLRTYGVAPFRVAVIHGGPGAPGSMAPVARELSATHGVLEPLQTADTLPGQLDELRAVLEAHASLPVSLIGHSWGAMLSFILAAEYPALVRNLILVGSGVFEARYAAHITDTSLVRLSDEDRREAIALMEMLGDPAIADEEKNAPLARLGQLFSGADAYDPITHESEEIDVQFHVHQQVWADAERLRATGALLELGRRIECPVVAVHGDYDPHPLEGVRDPLARVLRDFRFIVIARCGHEPWIEREARATFYRILQGELA